MFKELAPYLRQRAVLLTVTHCEDDQIRVVIVPQKLKDGENTALTTPLSVTGTAEELDRELPAAVVGFVAAHLQLKNTLDRVKEEMDEAAKAARAEARSKARTAGKSETAKPEAPAAAPNPAPPAKMEPIQPAGLFDASRSVAATAAEDEDENASEIEEREDDEEPVDEAA
jgi:PRTRC genetic system protein E